MERPPAFPGELSGKVYRGLQPGGLSNGTRLTVTVVITPKAAGVITNTAAVTSAFLDPALANNFAYETTAVVRVLYLPLARQRIGIVGEQLGSPRHMPQLRRTIE